MDWLQVFVLAVLQGLTEFLPVSSSAHLILVPVLLGWPDQGLLFDVAVHVGTLGAVLWYFRTEVWAMARDWFRSLAARRQVGESRLAWAVIAGTVPVLFFGFLVNRFAGDALRSPLVIAGATIVFGLVLWWADATGRRERDEHTLRWRDVALIGLAQALALIPGTSRSGITISAGLALGLTRPAAARFSFLLSIPVILLAGMLKGMEAWAGVTTVDWGPVIAGTVLSGVSAYLCIHLFLRMLEHMGMFPFVLYRLALGAVLLIAFL